VNQLSQLFIQQKLLLPMISYTNKNRVTDAETPVAAPTPIVDENTASTLGTHSQIVERPTTMTWGMKLCIMLVTAFTIVSITLSFYFLFRIFYDPTSLVFFTVSAIIYILAALVAMVNVSTSSDSDANGKILGIFIIIAIKTASIVVMGLPDKTQEMYIFIIMSICTHNSQLFTLTTD